MLRYAMSLPVATPRSPAWTSLDVLHQNLRVRPAASSRMTAEEMQALRDRCATVAGDGRYEFYKLSLRFDNPQARLPHGFPLDNTQKEVQEMLFQRRPADPKSRSVARETRNERSPQQSYPSRPRPARLPAKRRAGRRRRGHG